jgi:hypothetical protein
MGAVGGVDLVDYWFGLRHALTFKMGDMSFNPQPEAQASLRCMQWSLRLEGAGDHGTLRAVCHCSKR